METKDRNTQMLIGAALAAAVLLIIGYYFYISGKSREEIAPDPLGGTTAEESGGSEGDDGGGEKDGTPDVKVVGDDGLDFEEVLFDESVPAPSVDRPIVFSDTMPEEARVTYRKNIEDLTTTIKENGGTMGEWLSLGILWKQIGDYEGARLAWEYVSAIQPGNNISFLNLGDLYHYYLKDFVKAEENFKTGIKNDPGYAPGYVGLHELYKYSYKQNTSAAADILLQGLRATDNDINLLVPLAMYYAEKGDSDNARTYYQKALAAAEAMGDTARAELLRSELARL